MTNGVVACLVAKTSKNSDIVMSGINTGDNYGRNSCCTFGTTNDYRPTSHHFCNANDFCAGLLDNARADGRKTRHDGFFCRECISAMCIS